MYFMAYSLASIKGYILLNKPPANLGTGYQGFDVRYASYVLIASFQKTRELWKINKNLERRF